MSGAEGAGSLHVRRTGAFCSSHTDPGGSAAHNNPITICKNTGIMEDSAHSPGKSGGGDVGFLELERGETEGFFDFLGGDGEAAEGAAVEADEALDGVGTGFHEPADVVLVGGDGGESELLDRDVSRVLERVFETRADLPAEGFEGVSEGGRGARRALTSSWALAGGRF